MAISLITLAVLSTLFIFKETNDNTGQYACTFFHHIHAKNKTITFLNASNLDYLKFKTKELLRLWDCFYSTTCWSKYFNFATKLLTVWLTQLMHLFLHCPRITSLFQFKEGQKLPFDEFMSREICKVSVLNPRVHFHNALWKITHFEKKIQNASNLEQINLLW